LRRVIAPFSSFALVCALALAASAQVNPPVTPPPGPVNPPGSVVTPAPPPGATQPGALPPGTPPTATPVETQPIPGAPTPVPTAEPTQPPIVVEPPQIGVEPQKRASARINSSLGTLTVTVADPTIAAAVIDQPQRVLYVDGLKLGSTTVTVTDARGVSRTIPVLVAYAAGTVADETTLRVTGNPASAVYLRDALAEAAARAATMRPGATIRVSPDTIAVRGDLKLDNRTQINVPVTIDGNGYFGVSGTTHVMVENVALPPIFPNRLLVSDYPERLTADGVLFTARLDTKAPQRFLYYHFNPATEPARRILLKARNGSNAPATVQMVAGSAGPGVNEAEVGHLSTKRFLVHEARNEGTIVTVAPGATMNLVDHALPPTNVVSAILQLRLVSGDPLDLTLVAQNANAPLDQDVNTTQLLAGGAPHARGVYPVPTFYFDRTYDVDGADLEIPIGQLPLPNLREGEALSGDYGVEQSMTVVIKNQTRGPRNVALYANPRGGKATGTFLIDGTLVQAHGLAAFSKYKLWQEHINPGTFRRIHIVTMPEGGSSYPLRLIFAPDDGSVPPFAPGSPIY
jgi:Pilus formation protein N terminal region